ncbi:MAG: hypothetical protein H0X34_08290 [Chthoniobacterales bacterium]|nr:hypothetical protein [Gemmatimonadaceae bacterium]MBA3831877.1 hypothetical protein [Chthoniobacterales bacterium]
MRYDANEQGSALSDHQKFGGSEGIRASAVDAEHTVEHVVSEAKASISDASETMQERAGQLKTKLADKLEGGAAAVRSRTAETSGLDSAVSTTKEKLAGAGERVASGMEDTAGWLRGTDMASMQRSLEKQVKESPARTLLIAAGVGYLLGRAFKGRDG